MKRWLWIVIVLVVLAGGFFGFRQLNSAKAKAEFENIQTVFADQGELTAMIGATGKVEANQTAQLSFDTGGIVETIYVEPGDVVEKGQVLAVLEESSLSSQIILAQSDLILAQKALDDLLESDLTRAQTQDALAQAMDALDKAEYRWRVQQQGYRAGDETIALTEANLVLAQKQVDVAQREYSRYSDKPKDNASRALARANLATARINRDSLQRSLNWYNGAPDEIDQALLDAEVALAEAQFKDAEREFARWENGIPEEEIIKIQVQITAAQSLLDLAVIKAPFSGTITSVDIIPGDLVNIGLPVLHLSNLEHQVVNVEVSEVDINRIEIGQPVELTFDAVFETKYAGEVTDIAMEGFEVQGVVNFEVRLEILNPDENIKPGLTAAVNIEVEKLENALLVPNRAVRVVDGERVVYIRSEQEIVPVSITLGSSADLYSEVLDGELKVGDEIILNPPTEFNEQGRGPFGGG